MIPVVGGREGTLEIAIDEIKRVRATSSGLGNVMTTLLARETRLADRIGRGGRGNSKTIDEFECMHAFHSLVVGMRETAVPEREIEWQSRR